MHMPEAHTAIPHTCGAEHQCFLSYLESVLISTMQYAILRSLGAQLCVLMLYDHNVFHAPVYMPDILAMSSIPATIPATTFTIT